MSNLFSNIQSTDNDSTAAEGEFHNHDGVSSMIDDFTGQEPLSLMRSFDSHDQLTATFVKDNGLEEYEMVFNNASILLQTDGDPEDLTSITPTELQYLTSESTNKWHQPRTLYLAIFMCSLGAIEQGMAQTSMNGANLFFPKEFGIDSSSAHDTLIVGFINSGIYLSVGLIGAWLADPINDQIGRRGAICAGSAICVIGNTASAFSKTWQTLLIFRAVLGVGLGINSSTINVFAAECAPTYIRGGLAVCWQMFTAFGLLLGFIANIAVFHVSSPWRWQLGFPCLPAIPLALLIFTCPESPAWEVKNGQRYQNAFRSLQRLRNTNLQAAQEVLNFYHNHHGLPDHGKGSRFHRKLFELFSIPRNRRASLAAFVVMLSQQLCGINIIAFFSSTIFLNSGFSHFQALLASTVFGLVNFLGAIPAIWSMESLGRRSLLLFTLLPMAVTMLAAGLTFRLPEDSTIRFGALAAMIYLFCALYSPGMGPVPAPYSAEVFPLSHREIGMSFAMSVANTWAAILSLTFPRLVAFLGSESTFTLYALFNVFAFGLVYLFVPETRMKTLHELDEVFSIKTRDFVHFHIFEYPPWLVKRYVLRNSAADLKSLHSEVRYTLLMADES